MDTQQTLSEQPAPQSKSPLTRAIQDAFESKHYRKRSFSDYRDFIQNHYDGIAGNLTTVSGLLTGHDVLVGRVLRPNAFDLRGCKRILDAGCGNGRYLRHILRRADPDAFITAFDLSQAMLKRANRSTKSNRVHYLSADMTRLPYPDDFFDAITCGWVLEHLPDPRLGLREFARVLRQGGKLLLMTTEDTLVGSMCSGMWHCRTYSRKELRQAADDSGLTWHRQLYFSKLHRMFKIGGIIVELHRP